MKRSKLVAGMFAATLSAAALLGGCQGKPAETQKAAVATESAASTAAATTKEAPAAAAADASAAQAATASTAQAATASQASTAQAAAADATAKAAENAAAVQNAVSVTVETAQQTAFADAGVTADEVVIKKVGQDMDNGVAKFEIDFFANDTQYEYDINAATGEIISKEFEAMDAEDYAEMSALQGGAAATKAAVSGINEDGALEIALQDAGVAQSDITLVKNRLDYDDDLGKNIYEVEFNVGTTEYSYDIDPDTGAILSFDKDIDD